MTSSRHGSPKRTSGRKYSVFSRDLDNAMRMANKEDRETYDEYIARVSRKHKKWTDTEVHAYTVDRLCQKYPDRFQAYDSPELIARMIGKTVLPSSPRKTIHFRCYQHKKLFNHRQDKTFRHHPHWKITRIHEYTINRLCKKYPESFTLEK